MMPKQQLLPGMALGVQRLTYKHFGIYAGAFEGRELVIHYNDKIKGGNGEVELTSFEDFSKDDTWWIETFSTISYSEEACSKSLERATSRLGEKEYNLIFNNCEHFVSWCVTGKSHSKQITEIAIGLIKNPRSVILEKAIEIGMVAVGRSFQKKPVLTGVALGTIAVLVIGGLSAQNNRSIVS